MLRYGISNNYRCDFMDDSLHFGIPKNYYHLKDKKFGDWEIPPWELFIFMDRQIGEGAFSKVYLAKWRETFVVAKVIKEEVIAEKKFLILREIDIMSKMHHPNIVQFLGYIDDPFTIVMEYIPNKNLQENYGTLYKSTKLSIMKDILKGLAYIHNRKPYSLIHRDIKPTNIILTNSKVAKITDFGLSKFYSLTKTFSNNNLSNLDNNQNELYENDLTTDVGTLRFMAPEMKKKQTYDNKIDIYSCGVLLYELFENKKFIDKSQLNWCKTPKNIKNIILNYMLCEDPNDRYDALIILTLLN
jgi:serine/threonine protein kinase